MGHEVGHRSLLEWVNGSWVTVSDPLPALLSTRNIRPTLTGHVSSPTANHVASK